MDERTQPSSTDPGGAVGGVAPMVRAVVLNYNGDPHLFRCLDALTATEWPADRLQIVVVDNASADGSVDAVADRFPEVQVRPLTTNTGFPANNEALRDLNGVDYVALVNNDAFVTPGWLAPLTRTLEEDPELAAACPKLLFAPRFVELRITCPTFHAAGDSRALGVRVSGVEINRVDCLRASQFPPPGFWGIERGKGEEASFSWTDGDASLRVPCDPDAILISTVRVRMAAPKLTAVTLRCGRHRTTVDVGPTPSWHELAIEGDPFDVVQNAGSMVLAGGYGADRGFLEVDTGQYDAGDDVFAWCGAGVLFRPAYLTDVGLFDERFFAYYEDTDLAWRGRARGWRYRYVPESVVRHQHATTSVEGSVIFNRYVERNRLIMLTKNAPRRLALGAVGRYLLTTLSYGRRDIVGPLRRAQRPRFGVVGLRVASFAAYLRLLPVLLGDRRRLRRRQLVSDAELAAWIRPRP